MFGNLWFRIIIYVVTYLVYLVVVFAAVAFVWLSWEVVCSIWKGVAAGIVLTRLSCKRAY